MTSSFQPPPVRPEHEVFAKDVGTWDVSLEIRMGPGPSQASKGVAVGRLVSGGRWLVVDFRNETTDFEGHGVYGWDAGKGCYVATWVDDMRPFMAISTGAWDPATRTMTWTTDCPAVGGPADGPAPGGTTMRLRETMQSVDASTQVLRSFMPMPGGGEFEVITATYRRRT